MNYPIDPGFSLPGDKRLALAAGDNRESLDAVSEFLVHSITRSPGDLRSHVRRVYLGLHGQDRAGLLAGLLDLFIALGRLGAPLRARLLTQGRPLLDEAAFAFLWSRLESGVSAAEAHPAAPGAALSKGMVGTARLIRVVESERPSDRDHIQEARSYMEVGELDLARAILEEGVLFTPQIEPLHDDLLDIYRHTDDREGFRATRARLAAGVNPYPQKWREDEVFNQHPGRQ